MLPRRLRVLEANLQTGTTEDRLATIAELGRGHHPYALDLLYPTANHENPAIASAAQEAFAQFCAANPKVAMQHGSVLVRHEAAFVLGERRVLAAVDELSRVTRNDADPALRLACVQALGNIGGTTVIGGLRVALKDSAIKVRQAAFRALHSIGGAPVSDAVADLLGDHDWELRLQAHQLLLSTGWQPTTRLQKALWGIINGRFDDVVSQVPESIQPLLISTLRVNDAAVRQWSATALARIGSNDVRRRLRGALASPDAEIRRAASEALRIFGDGLADAVPDQRVSTEKPKNARHEILRDAFSNATWLMALCGHP